MAKTPFEVLASARGSFRFKLSEDSAKVWEIPLMGNLPLKQAQRLTRLSELDGPESVDAVVDALDQLCPGITDEISLTQAEALFERWAELSDVTVGESSGSAA